MAVILFILCAVGICFWGAFGASNLQFNNPLYQMVWWKRPIYLLVSCGPLIIPGIIIYFCLIVPCKWLSGPVENFFYNFEKWCKR